MIVASVFIDEPRAQHCYAYRDSLFVITYDHRLLVYKTSSIIDSLARQHGDIGLVVGYWLFTSSGRGVTKAMKEALINNQPYISRNIRLDVLPTRQIVLPFKHEIHLGMEIYYNQIFLATDSGTYSLPLNQQTNLPESIENEKALVPGFTQSISTGFGAVGCSLIDQGLAVVLNVDKQESFFIEEVPVRSLRSSLSWSRVVNFPSNDSQQMLTADFQVEENRSKRLIKVSAPPSDQLSAIPSDETGYLLWERGRFLASNNVGVFSHGKATRTSRIKQITEVDDLERSNWLGVSGNRWIVSEGSSKLLAFNSEAVTVLHQGEIAFTYVFPRSQRYRRLITSSVEGGLLLSAIMGESERR